MIASQIVKVIIITIGELGGKGTGHDHYHWSHLKQGSQHSSEESDQCHRELDRLHDYPIPLLCKSLHELRIGLPKIASMNKATIEPPTQPTTSQNNSVVVSNVAHSYSLSQIKTCDVSQSLG